MHVFLCYLTSIFRFACTRYLPFFTTIILLFMTIFIYISTSFLNSSCPISYISYMRDGKSARILHHSIRLLPFLSKMEWFLPYKTSFIFDSSHGRPRPSLYFRILCHTLVIERMRLTVSLGETRKVDMMLLEWSAPSLMSLNHVHIPVLTCTECERKQGTSYRVFRSPTPSSFLWTCPCFWSCFLL